MPFCQTEASRSAGDAVRDVARLRRTIAAIERGPAGTCSGHEAEPERLPLGVPEVDAALGGGLLSGALHEASALASGALAGFVLALAARAVARRGRPLLLVQQELLARESGVPSAPGLAAFGLPAGALLLVRVRRPQDVLFVMEEGLRCPGIAAVVGEVCASLPDALTATRRLSLAARDQRTLGILARHTAQAEPCAAASRWTISPLPSPAPDGLGGLGLPRVRARLVRNRWGPPGDWPLAFAADGFRLAPEGRGHDAADPGTRPPVRHVPALSRPEPAAAAHGPHRTQDVA